jgi:hypothetical protein
MKNSIRKIVFIEVLIFLLMQLYQPVRNVNNEPDLTVNYTNIYTVPKNVQTIFRTSCYDCHSNSTNYHWYSNIQPVRFFMEEHIKNGKKNLNFDEFGSYSKRKQKSKLESISKQIESKKMPLTSYTLTHRNAILSNNQKEKVINWINTLNEDE